jgi:uncharacterized protein
MTERHPGFTARGLQRAVRAYQLVTINRSPVCRYQPTCSEYAHEALATHGALRGSWLALRRLSRCHPLGRHGYDPVPHPPLDLHRRDAAKELPRV